MTQDVKRPLTAYPRRRLRALATRSRVIEAARVLFLDLGYVSTTINAIAEGADVAPETVYASFGNKRSLLAALVDVSIAGDAAAPPILEQDWVRSMSNEPDPRRRLRILASQGRKILERRWAVDGIVEGAAAADPEIAAMRDRGRVERFDGQRRLLAIVVAATRLRNGIDVEAAADVLYALGSPETFRLLVIDRGWTADAFQDWYAETLDRLFFEPDSTVSTVAPA